MNCFSVIRKHSLYTKDKKNIKLKVGTVEISYEGGTRMLKIEVPVWEKVSMSIEEASALSSIGIVKLREMTSDPRCPFVLHVGRGKRLVKRKEFVEYISKHSEL